MVVYSDPIALRLADPKDSIEKAYKSRMTLVKEKNGQWTQVEKVDDINAEDLRCSGRLASTMSHRGH